MASPKTNESSTIPSPYQIWRGYDSFNNEVASVQVEVLEPNINYTIMFTGLKPATDYEVFVVAGSNHPNFPDLLSSGAVVSLESSTRDPNDDDLGSGASLRSSISLVLFSALLLLQLQG